MSKWKGKWEKPRKRRDKEWRKGGGGGGGTGEEEEGVEEKQWWGLKSTNYRNWTKPILPIYKNQQQREKATLVELPARGPLLILINFTFQLRITELIDFKWNSDIAMGEPKEIGHLGSHSNLCEER